MFDRATKGLIEVQTFAGSEPPEYRRSSRPGEGQQPSRLVFDYLAGLGGQDYLVGGAGADRFAYGSIGQSPVAGPDRIADFSHAQGDRIDLASIDANTLVAGDQAFNFIGGAPFTP